MTHREEALWLLTPNVVLNYPVQVAQVHALLAIAEALTRQPEDLSPDELLAIEHIRGGHQHGEYPRMCPTCQTVASSHRGNGCGCGTPNRSPWLLRVWTTSDGDSHSTPHHRTDVYLCSGHVPGLPIEHNTSMSSAAPDDRADYDRQIRPLLQFDGAPSAVITHFYLSENAP